MEDEDEEQDEDEEDEVAVTPSGIGDIPIRCRLPRCLWRSA